MSRYANAYACFRTLELDVELGGEAVSLRLELFRALGEAQVYRARVWRRDLFRLTPSFPRDERDQPTEISDDTVWVEWAELLEDDYERFEASGDDDAEARVLDAVEAAVTAASWAV